jgi:hypothetical protein
VQPRVRTFVGAFLVAVAIVLPCFHFVPVGASFYIDWHNHEWAIGYFGAYFRANHTMPSLFNTNDLTAMAQPVFYGNLFYPTLGLPSSVLAPGIVIRLAALGVFFAQYRLVSQALLRLGAPGYFARIVGILVIWAIYPLTNLYNRGALTEFFATTLLVCALAALVLLIHARDARERRLYASGAMFALTIAAGTHPITAMYGGPVFAALVPVFWWTLRGDPSRRRATLRALAPWVAVAIVCVLPWYLVSRSYANDVLVRNTAPDVSILSWDTWTSRFYPIPWDSRLGDGVNPADVGTPYLDAQISWSLAFVFIALAAIAIANVRRSRVPIIALAIGGLFTATFTWLSLSRTGYQLLPAIAVMIQYVYRAVTYINLSLLLGILLLVMALRTVTGIDIAQTLRRRSVIAACCAALALAGVGVIVKLDHVDAIKEHKSSPHWRLSKRERRELVQLPWTYYGKFDYVTGGLFEAIPDDEPDVLWRNFPVNAGKRFGRTGTITVELTRPTWVMANALSFPWVGLAIDGVAVPRSQIRTRWAKTVVMVPEGTHRITLNFDPPLWWRFMRPLSIVLVFAWSGFLISPLFAKLWRRLRKKPGAEAAPS